MYIVGKTFGPFLKREKNSVFSEQVVVRLFNVPFAVFLDGQSEDGFKEPKRLKETMLKVQANKMN